MSQLLLKTKTAGYVMALSPNQLLQTGALDNAAWTATSASLVSGQTDPSAGTTAYTMTATAANATLTQSLALVGAVNRTLSFYIKRKTGTGAIQLTLDGTTWQDVTVSGSWVRYSILGTASGTVTPGIRITTLNDAVDVCWPQYEDGPLSDYAGTDASRYIVQQIVDADYPLNTTRGVVFLDGRFFVMTPAGEIYQSALENGLVWDALEFIQSQANSDKGVYLARAQNNLLAMKEWSLEFFYDAANPTGSILAPVINATQLVGCAHEDSVKDIAGSLVWLGQTQEGLGRAVFMLNGQVPQKISSPAVDKICTRSTLATVYSWAANVGSHLLYGLTLVDLEITLVYDMGTQWWSTFTHLELNGTARTVSAVAADGKVTYSGTALTDGEIVLLAGTNEDFNGWHIATDVTATTFYIQATGTAFSGSGTAQAYTESYFPISASTRCNGKQYMQHATTGVLYEFSQTAYTDAVGAIAARIRTPKFDAEDVEYRTISELEVVGDKVATHAVIRHSDDDFQTFSPGRAVDLVAERSRIRRCGRFSRRAFEVLHVGNALLRLEALEITVK